MTFSLRFYMVKARPFAGAQGDNRYVILNEVKNLILLEALKNGTDDTKEIL